MNDTQPLHHNGPDMLALLKKNLLTDLHHIKQLYKNKKLSDLLRQLHKLHGAVCYCGVPSLKLAIAELETALRQKRFLQVAFLFEVFEKEVSNLLE